VDLAKEQWMFSFVRGITIWSALVVLALVSGIAAAPANGQETAVIAGNHSPSIDNLAAPQPAPADQLLQMSITLNPSNRTALEALRAGQQDPASPNYRRWLKPGEFDRRFGPDPAVRAAIVQWLATAGFTVSQSKGDRWRIKFSGSVAQAEHGFGVPIVSQDYGRHFANLADPSVPAQFAGEIGFIDGLDNLRGAGKTMGIVPGSAANPGPQSLALLNGGRAFAPSDFYTFYDVNPLLNSRINGAGGGCIGLIEVSDYSAPGITNFDKAFKLLPANITRVVASDSDNPGQNSRVDETMLDIEYSHTFAPGAPISVYLSDPATFSANPILATVDALDTAVNEDTCTALSISIESCGFPPTYYTGALHTIYLKAATQGQTVFVAEGDEGAAEFQAVGGICVLGTSRNVNELASDPLVTAIGGTQFKPKYNSAGNDVGFVPESVWNEPKRASTGISAGGGGVSTVWPKPPFQTTIDTPNDGARDVPDISIEAACSTPGAFSVFPDQASGNKVSCCACGTSIGAPMWAGITELILQSDGQQPMSTFTSFNTRLYQLGHMQNTAVTGIRDVTKGNNDFENVIGFPATPGFDLATGWGTPDVTKFVSAFIDTALVSANLVIKPLTLNFGKSTLKNSTSAPLPLTITNASSGATGMLVSITGQSTSSPFVVSHQCNTTLLPGKSCTVKVTFHPTDTAVLHTGQLMIADNAAGAPQSVVLMGTGKKHK
jgi:subtilase family serine protease